MTRRARASKRIKIAGYEYAYPWDDKPKRCSKYIWAGANFRQPVADTTGSFSLQQSFCVKKTRLNSSFRLRNPVKITAMIEEVDKVPSH